MIWQDKGFLLHYSAFGERNFIVTFLTEQHGRARGWVKNNTPHFIPGNAYHVMWKSRLDDHLGRFSLDEDYGFFWTLSHHQGALRALHLMCAICSQLLPERVAMPGLFRAFQSTLEQLHTPNGLRAYNHFETILFQELGYDSGLEPRVPDGATGKDIVHGLGQRHHDYVTHWPNLYALHRMRHAFIAEVSGVFSKMS